MQATFSCFSSGYIKPLFLPGIIQSGGVVSSHDNFIGYNTNFNQQTNRPPYSASADVGIGNFKMSLGSAGLILTNGPEQTMKLNRAQVEQLLEFLSASVNTLVLLK